MTHAAATLARMAASVPPPRAAVDEPPPSPERKSVAGGGARARAREPLPADSPRRNVVLQQLIESVAALRPDASNSDIEKQIQQCRRCAHLETDGCHECGTCADYWARWRNRVIAGCKSFLPIVDLSNPNPEACAACGGQCCRRSPIILYPEEVVPLTAERLEEMVATGHYELGQWPWPDGTVTHVISTVAGVEGCGLLTGTGCELPFGARPLICREFVPSPPRCHAATSKTLPAAAEAWKSHQGLFHFH